MTSHPWVLGENDAETHISVPPATCYTGGTGGTAAPPAASMAAQDAGGTYGKAERGAAERFLFPKICVPISEQEARPENSDVEVVRKFFINGCDQEVEEGDNLGEASGPLGERVSWTPTSCTPSSSSAMSTAELPRKRKGEADSFLQEPHRQIEKRRRDKMNNLIDELSTMLPSCNPMSRKLDKLTVLRTAVQHLKALKVGTTSSDSTYKPSFLPEDDFKHIVLRAADGFLLVVSCDRGKILFISESVSKILNFSRLELTGQSLFHYLHPKDISKVKEQLSASEFPRERLVDATTGAKVEDDSPLAGAYLSTGARRSFFCRMKHCRVSSGTSKKKDAYRYCTVHCTGYMRSWPTSQLDEESDTEKESSHLTCLVTVCRMHPHSSHQPPREVKVKPTEFVMRCAIDGKFTYVDQQATIVIGYLPQEVLGTSCYDYFHQDDLQHLTEKHRQVLRSKEKIETNCYKFKTKYGPYVSLQSQWFSFTNPWTKEVEFIVSSNRVISDLNHTKEDDEAGSSKALHEDSKRILPIIPGLSSGAGKMIYAGSIGTQIANELIDTYRMSSSPSSGAASPFGPGPERSPLVSPHSSRSLHVSARTPSDAGPLCLCGCTAETSPLDLDNLVVPGLSSISNDEATMEVIMSLLESDTSIGQAVDFEDIHWPV
ncbi:Aryl hydrocarbon receptor nuclear translocator-like protein 2 [Merluccius polli]|uniref:Aryl hydrocarbon receptor nuclear translocator-like protein 2 n=1 Tax=Merluccius polli TaxID=89951 RepID=A0AA47MV07_MERPO|nr:Aryl hydrocarbon receptor nuclear translocator-like protein 2 [Merluccius polli]